MLDRTKAPKYFSPSEFDYNLSKFKTKNLNNGVPIYYLESTNNNIVQIDFVFDAGNVYDINSAIPLLTHNLLKSGTSKKTSLEINQILEHYGAFIDLIISNEYASVQIKILSKNFAHILPTLFEMLTDTQFPQSEVDILLNKTKKNMAINLERSNYVANRKINELIFGKKHIYGINFEIKDFDKISSDDLKKFYDEYYKKGNCKIFASGFLTEDFFDNLNNFFGKQSWFNNSKIKNYGVITNESEREFLIENKKDGLQSSIRIGRMFVNKTHPDYLKSRVLNIVLGGYFGSRLMQVIREQKGYTYGINSYIQNNLKECAWVITTETKKDISKDAVNCIFEEMQKLQLEKISEEELLNVKNFYLGVILGDIDGTLNIMNIWRSIILSGTELDYFDRNISTIKNITEGEIQQLAQKYFNKNDFISLIVN